VAIVWISQLGVCSDRMYSRFTLARYLDTFIKTQSSTENSIKSTCI